MSLFDHPEFDGHEQLIHVADNDSGLRAIIALHDSTLGPAVGGCRLYPYASEDDALTDVLRLSRGMTYKNALAGLPMGGGKSVIIARSENKTPALLAAYARALEALGGRYWTGEDVNIGPADVEEMARTSRYLLGRMNGNQGSGDPSPFTARGCFEAMKAAMAHRFGSDSFEGRTVAIQGLGNVGFALGKLVCDAGGALVVTDVRADLDERASELAAATVSAEAIYDANCDLFAPCAMGGTVNRETIPRLKAGIVCGVANNQLGTVEDGERLLERGIDYAPDYVVNAGGIINASGEFLGHYDRDEALAKVIAVGRTVGRILDRAKAEGRPTNRVADEMARQVIDEARARR